MLLKLAIYYTTYLSKPDLDRLLNKALQAPSFGGGCVIPITVPYSVKNKSKFKIAALFSCHRGNEKERQFPNHNFLRLNAYLTSLIT